jgi:hypothetical protein
VPLLENTYILQSCTGAVTFANDMHAIAARTHVLFVFHLTVDAAAAVIVSTAFHSLAYCLFPCISWLTFIVAPRASVAAINIHPPVLALSLSLRHYRDSAASFVIFRRHHMRVCSFIDLNCHLSTLTHYSERSFVWARCLALASE